MTALAGLPDLAPAEAQLRTDLLEALNGIEADGGLLIATLPGHAPSLTWFVCADGLAFALDRVAGGPVRLADDDGAAAAAALDTAEPLLRAIEWALGIELEPQDLADDLSPGERLLLRIEVDAGRTSLYLAVPHPLAIVARPAPFAPRLLDPVPFPASLTLSGPRLSPAEAADLEPGDLLLLGEGPLRANLAFLGRAPLPGLYDPADRRFVPLDGPSE